VAYISTWPYSQDLVDEYRKYMDPSVHAKLFSGYVRTLYQSWSDRDRSVRSPAERCRARWV